MNVRTLMKNLKKSLSSIKETFLDGIQTLTIFVCSNWIINNFIENRLILLHRIGVLKSGLSFIVK